MSIGYDETEQRRIDALAEASMIEKARRQAEYEKSGKISNDSLEQAQSANQSHAQAREQAENATKFRKKFPDIAGYESDGGRRRRKSRKARKSRKTRKTRKSRKSRRHCK